MRSDRLVLLIAALLTLAPPAQAQPGIQRPNGDSGAPPANYVVGPNDVLGITVWNEEDLSGKYVVDADGAFTFPLIGRVQVAGRSLKQVEETLRQRLADGFLRKPQVTAQVEEYRSRRIFVMGEVRTPGPYPLTGEMRLLEALARAGSTTPVAADEVLIIRPRAGATAGPVQSTLASESEVTNIPMRDLRAGSHLHNIALQDGDTVFVPRAELVYVFGQVRSPGAYPIQAGTTVLQALSLAGGVTERGSTSRIRIVREISGKKVELRGKLGDLVCAFQAS